MNMAPEVAVIPGHGYVICNSENVIAFPSRKKAIREDALMYRVYVDSWIQQDGKDVGANVYFLLGNPLEHGQMPEMNSGLGTLSWDMENNKSRTISVKLPSEDIEVDGGFEILTCSSKGRNLTLSLSHSPMSYDIGNQRILIRSGMVYTSVNVSISY